MRKGRKYAKENEKIKEYSNHRIFYRKMVAPTLKILILKWEKKASKL